MPKVPKANEPGDASQASGQAAVLQAIDSLKAELMTKIDEKAEVQRNELSKQISNLGDELKESIEQASSRVSMLEERMASLEEGANTHSDKIASNKWPNYRKRF